MQRFDARLVVTAGVLPQAQSRATLSALEHAVAAADDWRLAALALAVHAAGSLVIGLALGEGRLDAVAAFDAAELDATFPIQAWGGDPEAAKPPPPGRGGPHPAARFPARPPPGLAGPR